MTPHAPPRSLEEAAAQLRAGATSAHALAELALERIAARNRELNVFVTVVPDQALTIARERDAELAAGRDRGPLHGIPIAHKDCYDTAGVLSTVGADIFRARVPQRDAEVVAKLAAAGAVMLGKTHMNEFAAGMSGKNAFYGDARNPRDPARAAGGSSSGSAGAVAAGLCFGATGTDAGGSIRIPAAWTGIVGLRPSFGRVSTAGIYPRAASFDCAGPLAASVADAALLFAAMAGEAPAAPAAAQGDLRGVRLGVVRDFTFQGVEEDVAVALRGALDALRGLGAEVREIALPALSAADHGAMLDILLYEFHRVLGAEYRATAGREKRFGPIVRANLERAAVLRPADYQAAIDARSRFTRELREAFAGVDALLTPTAPMTAPPLSAPEAEFDRARRFTLPFSLAGVPAISIPCGADRAGLPVGLQIAADKLQEPLLFRIAGAYEAVAMPRR